MSTLGVYPSTEFGLVCEIYSRRGLSVLLIHFTGSQDLGVG